VPASFRKGEQVKNRVLIVDEETDFRSDLAVALKVSGFETSEADDGFEAFEKILRRRERGETFDLLVAPIRMSVQGGVELLQRLEEYGMDLPTLFTTYFMDEYLFAGLMRSQCRDYIEKPVAAAEVAERVRRILEGAGETLPSGAVFSRKGGAGMRVEWFRSDSKK
jgi:DNA-binding NtrC family response regulator